MHLRLRAATSALALLVFGSCQVERAQPTPRATPRLSISAEAPSDVAGGAGNADLEAAAEYAWQQFIALNWPAQPGKRDVADHSRKFGAPGGPVVWQTFRSRVEVYPGNGSATVGPHGYDQGPTADYGYDDLPAYTYEKDIPPCAGQTPVTRPAWINLDEISQVGFNNMYAGVIGGTNESNRMIRFTAKANRTNYRYVAASRYWYKDSPELAAATKAYTDAVTHGFPIKGAFVQFPNGTMEAKAAYRRLTPAEAKSGRFHITRVRFYDPGPCYREDDWGLVGLHLIMKTPTAPAFTWATFEQGDNILTTAEAGVVPAEDENGNVLHQRPANTPELLYNDGEAGSATPPRVAIKGDVYCTDPGARLYYREIAANTSLPSGGAICVEGRMHPIPNTIIQVNRDAHQAIADYEKANKLPHSPWNYYKLVNVQVRPFDKANIDPNDDSIQGSPAYHTSNMLIETDYTLQNHSGGPEPITGGAPSDIATNFPPAEHDPLPQYQNVYAVDSAGNLLARYNMGGCTGCHGLTSVRAGTDYSYILFNSSVLEPETPTTPTTTLRERYIMPLARR